MPCSGLEKVFHILVIDDGSPDGTAAIVKGLQKEFPGASFLSWSVRGSWDWVPLISGVLNGLSSINMILFSRWTPISVIIPMTAEAIRRLYRAGCRRSHRVEVLQRGECGELAVGPCVDVLFRLGVCPYRHGYEDTGYDGGF